MSPRTKRRRSDSSSSSSSSSDSSSSDSSGHETKGKKSRSNQDESSDSSLERKSKSKSHKKHQSKRESGEEKNERKTSGNLETSKPHSRNSREEHSRTEKTKRSSSRNEDYHRHRRNDNNEYDSRHQTYNGRDGRSYDKKDNRGDRRDERGRHEYPRDNHSSPGRDRRDNRNGRRYRRSRSFDHANAKWGKEDSERPKNDGKPKGDKQKPNFALSGKLTEETNTFKGVVIKYSEPPEARKPKRRWRLYPFKGEKALQTLYIHRESAYLIGRDRKVVDLPVDHPSCSKQHAALQYRLVTFTRDDGSSGKRVRPYLIDLESANGTIINGKKIEPKKYVELLERDVIQFGFSSREYVLLHENSKDEALDDDVKMEEEEVEVKKEKKEET